MTTIASDTIDVQVLHDILINLVTAPEEVKIDRKVDEQGVLLSVTVNVKDMGIVIGRNGSMAMSIKTIMRAVGKAHNMNVRIQFLEPDGSVRYADKKSEKEDGQTLKEPHYNTPSYIDSSLIDDDLSEFVIN
jgi:predicted RNA-binding protein YlqC (UPF0109 family)